MTRWRLEIKTLRGEWVHFGTCDGATLVLAEADAWYNYGGYMKGRAWRLVEDHAQP